MTTLIASPTAGAVRISRVFAILAFTGSSAKIPARFIVRMGVSASKLMNTVALLLKTTFTAIALWDISVGCAKRVPIAGNRRAASKVPP